MTYGYKKDNNQHHIIKVLNTQPDSTIPHNKPNIIIRYNEDRKCYANSYCHFRRQKETEKIQK